MADTIWQGSTGNWNTAGNWTNGVPGAGATAIFDGTSQVSVDEGLDQSAAGTLLRIRTHPEYRGSIGASGSDLIINAKNVEHLGLGQFYIDQRLNGSWYALLDSKNRSANALYIDGTYFPERLDVIRGTCYVDGSEVSYSAVTVQSHGNVTIGSTVSTLQMLTVSGGTVEANGITINYPLIRDGECTLTNCVLYYHCWVVGGTLTFLGDWQVVGQMTILGGLVDCSRGVLGNAPIFVLFPQGDAILTAEQRAALTLYRDLNETFPDGRT